jgi:hypothetical protein
MINKLINLFFLIYCVVLFPIQNYADQVDAADTKTYADTEAYYVGEMGSAWQFPSDHLPIGATVDHFHIAFWNILNKNYLHHIETNTQGLKQSSILSDNVPDLENLSYEKRNLTKREQIVVQSILEMIEHPTNPRSVIALQEVHPDVLNYLKFYLVESYKKSNIDPWEIVLPSGQSISEDIYIYNSEIFSMVGKSAKQYTPGMPKSIFSLTLQDRTTKKIYRFVQSHIPGGPSSPEGCAKFSLEAMRQFDPNMTIVLMGDMNQSPKVIDEALHVAAANAGFDFQPYKYLPVNYPIHMNTHLEASWIDNIFVYRPEDEPAIQASNNPEEVCSILEPIVSILKSLKNKE